MIPETFQACPIDCDLPHDCWSTADVDRFTAQYPVTPHATASRMDCCPLHRHMAVISTRTAVTRLATMPDPFGRGARAWLDYATPLFAQLPLFPSDVDLGIALDIIFQADLHSFLATKADA